MKKDNYIENGACECPFCGSSKITGERVEYSDDTASRVIECDDCNEKWVENFDTDKDNPKTCHCNDDNYTYEDCEEPGTTCFQETYCKSCESKWQIGYTITSWEKI